MLLYQIHNNQLNGTNWTLLLRLGLRPTFLLLPSFNMAIHTEIHSVHQMIVLHRQRIF